MRELDEALELLHFGFRRVVQEPDRVLGKRGLGRVHHRILYFVRTRAPLTPAALAQVLGITKQALHAPLQALLSRELVAAEADASDARRRVLTLTRNGRKLEEELSGAQRRMFERAFAVAGKHGERGFAAVMRALADT
jgi:DNA-binding MarR family transcriptional regulator